MVTVVLKVGFSKLNVGNKRLQEMMGQMAMERGAKLFATDERYVSF